MPSMGAIRLHPTWERMRTSPQEVLLAASISAYPEAHIDVIWQLRHAADPPTCRQFALDRTHSRAATRVATLAQICRAPRGLPMTGRGCCAKLA